jgi:hypothetical protein
MKGEDLTFEVDGLIGADGRALTKVTELILDGEKDWDRCGRVVVEDERGR